MTSISERIIEGMATRNMKQIDIIEATGINKGSLSSYISGKYKPKQTNVYKIAKALDVSEAWLMGYDVPMEQNSKNSKFSPSSFDISNSTTYTELNLLNKYRLLDDKGKHTVDTVLDMEYNRYRNSDNSKVVKINTENDRSHLIPLASHERTDIEVTEEMKKHDDSFFHE